MYCYFSHLVAAIPDWPVSITASWIPLLPGGLCLLLITWQPPQIAIMLFRPPAAANQSQGAKLAWQIETARRQPYIGSGDTVKF